MTTLERLEKADYLFHAALEHDPDERGAFLAEGCQGDLRLQREVELLLAADSLNGDFLQSTGLELSASDIFASVLTATDETSVAGQRIGAYRVVREIGRGGMGVVYLAERDDDEYAQQVAIKLIKRGMHTEAILHRFRKERQILADLNHPNIANLLDGGQTADGLPFIVMEYIEGQPIHEYARTHNLSTDERLKLFLTVCDTVHYLHHNRLIHRDLKPRNILVTADGTLKLLDFGITKLLNTEAVADSGEATVTALRVMTPEYASPEQLRGLTLTPLSDLYSLGILLCELLTGERPHAFQSRLPHEILQALEQTEPIKPSLIVAQKKRQSAPNYRDDEPSQSGDSRVIETLAGEQLSRRLRGDLDNIVLMALALEPERRYASVEQFAEDIRRHLQGLPVTARKDTVAYRSTKFLKRHKASVIAAAAALLCLLAGLSFSLFLGRAKARESVAVMPFISTNQDANTQYISEAISETLMDYVSRIPNLSVPPRGAVLRYKGQTEDLQLVGQALGVEVLVSGMVTVEGETVSVKIELIDTGSEQVISSKRHLGKTSEILTLEQELAKEVSQKLALQIDPETQAAALNRQTENAEAYKHYLRGNYFWNQRTEVALRQGVESFQAAVDKDPNYALAYVGIANSYSLLGAYKSLRTKVAFANARSAVQKALEIDPNLAEAHNALALIEWLHEWNWAEADSEFKRAIELNPSYARAHHWYGLYLAEMGRFEEAIRQENLALEIDPNSVYIRADLGRVYFYARQYEESLREYRKAAELAPTHEAFFAECLPVYEQLNMYDEWSAKAKLIGWLDDEDSKLFSAGGIASLRRRSMKNFLTSKDLGYEYALAEYYAQDMKKERAYEMLERSYEVRDHQMAQLKVNPRFDNLRSDPRFKNLLHRMNLAP